MELPEDHVTRKTVLCRVPGMDAVRVQADLRYGRDEDGSLTLDICHPPEEGSALRPAVVLVNGYPDPGMQRIFGCRFKEWGAATSWARLIAASGLSAVTYANLDPVIDLGKVLGHLRDEGAAMGIDGSRLALLAFSGHGPLALEAIIESGAVQPLRAAALLCPFTLDLDGSTAVADAARAFRFANPAAGRSVDDFPQETALFVARAGQDEMPGLNASLDRFAAKALARNLPLTLVNLPEAPHAFDVNHDRETSRHAIRSALAFLRFRLCE